MFCCTLSHSSQVSKCWLQSEVRWSVLLKNTTHHFVQESKQRSHDYKCNTPNDQAMYSYICGPKTSFSFFAFAACFNHQIAETKQSNLAKLGVLCLSPWKEMLHWWWRQRLLSIPFACRRHFSAKFLKVHCSHFRMWLYVQSTQ